MSEQTYGEYTPIRIDLNPREFYERPEDMSRDGRLRVMIEDDGDVIVQVTSEGRHFAAVQFCTIGSGGGRSPRVRAALLELARAIKADNEERPI